MDHRRLGFAAASQPDNQKNAHGPKKGVRNSESTDKCWNFKRATAPDTLFWADLAHASSQ